MIKAEVYQDKAIVMDQYGRIWQIEIVGDMQPQIRLLKEVPRDIVNYIMWPKLLAAAGILP